MIKTVVVITRLRKLQLGCLAALVLMIAALSPDAHAQFLHPKITSKQVTVRKVVILPAKVEVVRDSMKGPEGMAAESEELSGRVEKMSPKSWRIKSTSTHSPYPHLVATLKASTPLLIFMQSLTIC